jgi:two-component system chemotaxis response regulator CheB
VSESTNGGDGSQMKSKVRVLVVDDSSVCREFLTHILGADPSIEVVGAACDGASALKATAALRPDVITMDIEMPGMNGFDATRRIMEFAPTPIIVVSSSTDASEQGMSFKAMESGALAVLPKPRGGDSSRSAEQARELILMIKLMAEVKVIKRWARSRKASPSAAIALNAPPNRLLLGAAEAPEAIFIGASTGGPLPLRTILSLLPRDFPAAILVVQHIAPGFGAGFTEWLAEACRLPVRIAADGERVLPGCVYIAPDGAHMGIEAGPRISLGRGDPVNGSRPSVSYLFRSAARTYGKGAVGIILSGMGKDGSEELKTMKDNGAVTFAQDEKSCVIFGMPGEAVRLGAASFTMAPERIAAAVIDLVGKAGGARLSPR